MLTSGARLEQKNGVLELTKLEYPKKWYFPTYFANSVFGPNISTIDANGPFWPRTDIFNNRVETTVPSPIWWLLYPTVMHMIKKEDKYNG